MPWKVMKSSTPSPTDAPNVVNISAEEAVQQEPLFESPTFEGASLWMYAQGDGGFYIVGSDD